MSSSLPPSVYVDVITGGIPGPTGPQGADVFDPTFPLVSALESSDILAFKRGAGNIRAVLSDLFASASAARAGLMFDSIAHAKALIPGLKLALGSVIATGFHTIPEDDGGGLYQKVLLEPAGFGKFMADDNSWWMLISQNIKAGMFGATGLDDGTDNGPALVNALNWCKNGQYVELRPGGTYGSVEPIVIPDKRGPVPNGGLNGTGFIGHGSAMIKALAGAVDTSCVICTEAWNRPTAGPGNIAPVLHNVIVDANNLRTHCFANMSFRCSYRGNFFLNALGAAVTHLNVNRLGVAATGYIGDNVWEGNVFRFNQAGFYSRTVDCELQNNFFSSNVSWGWNISCGGHRITGNKLWSNGSDGVSGCAYMVNIGYGTVFQNNHFDIPGMLDETTPIPGGVFIDGVQTTSDSARIGLNDFKCPLIISNPSEVESHVVTIESPRFQSVFAYLYLNLGINTRVIVKGGVTDHVHPIQWQGESTAKGILECEMFYSTVQQGHFDGLIHPYQPSSWTDGPAVNLKTKTKVSSEASVNPLEFIVDLKVASTPRASTALTIDVDLSAIRTGNFPTFWSGTILANYTRQFSIANNEKSASIAHKNDAGGGFGDPVLTWTTDASTGEQTVSLKLSFPTVDLTGNPSTAQARVRGVHHGIRVMNVS